MTKSHSYMVLVTECQSVGKVQDAEVFRITQATLIPLSVKADLELVLEVGKLLACGQFYFSHPNTALFDLLSPAQLHGSGREQKHFCWLVYVHCAFELVGNTTILVGIGRCTPTSNDSVSTARNGCTASCAEESRYIRFTLGTSRRRLVSFQG